MSDSKKALKEAYKNRKITGCVYIVRNARNGRYYLNYSDVGAAPANSFALSVSAGSPFKPGMAADWKEHGAQAFVLEILEEMEKKEAQSPREFAGELAVLADLWAEKFDAALRY